VPLSCKKTAITPIYLFEGTSHNQRDVRDHVWITGVRNRDIQALNKGSLPAFA